MNAAIPLRPPALPYEHGAWGFLLEPLILGLLVAPSPAGFLIAAGTLAAFLARHPFRLAVRDWTRGKRYPRTEICEAFAFVYAAPAGAAIGAAFLLAGARPLIALTAAVPIALVQFVLDIRSGGRSLLAELAGGLAPGAAAAAIVLAANRPAELAFALWALLAARSVASILYVRCALRQEPRLPMLLAHAGGIALAAALADVTAIVATSVLLIRALPSTKSLTAKQIGVRELAFGALFVALLAI